MLLPRKGDVVLIVKNGTPLPIFSKAVVRGYNKDGSLRVIRFLPVTVVEIIKLELDAVRVIPKPVVLGPYYD